ncbi:MAG: hypothetical protein AAF806_09005 [Bacteroidota bacterium]
MKYYFILLLSLPFFLLNCEKEVPNTQVYRGIIINGCDSSVMANASISISRLGRIAINNLDNFSEAPAVEAASTISDENGFFEMKYEPVVASSGIYSVEIIPPTVSSYGYNGDRFWFFYSAAPLLEQNIVICEKADIALQLKNATYDSLSLTVYDSGCRDRTTFIPFDLARGQDTLLLDSLSCGNLRIEAVGYNAGSIGMQIDTFHTERLHLSAGEKIEYSFKL